MNTQLYRLYVTSRNWLCQLLAIALLLTLGVGNSMGQSVRHYADSAGEVTNPGALGSATVSNLTNAVSSNPTTFATMTVTSGLGSSTAYINLRFSSTIPAGTTVYVRLSGSTSGLLSGLGGSLTVSPYNNNTALLAANFSLVKDLFSPEGSFLWAITATTGFNTVRVSITSGALLDGGSINVHHAFYITGQDFCQQPLYSAIGTDGLTLDLLGTGPKVINPSNAIDSDTTNYSTLSLGSGVTIGVGNGVYQDVYFPQLSPVGYGFRITLKSPVSVLDVTLFSGVLVKAYDANNNIVFENNLNNILGVDLLGLAGGAVIPIDINTSVTGPFSRIRVELGKALNIALLNNGMRFYGAEVIPPPPSLQGNANVSVCLGSGATLSVLNPDTTDIYNWYNPSGTLLGTGSSISIAAGSLLVSDSSYIFYVARQRLGCPEQESTRIPVTITVNPLPAAAVIPGSFTVCKDSAKILTVNPVTNTGYHWYKTATGGTSFFTGNSYTTSHLAADTTLYVEAYNTNTGCISSGRTLVNVTVSIIPNTITGNQVVCAGTAPSAITSSAPTAVESYTFQWQKSVDSIAFTDITGATGLIFTDTVVTATTFYRRKAVSGSCASFSNVIKVTVNPLPTITLGTDPVICEGILIADLTYSTTNYGPDKYSIVWSSGLINVIDATLLPSPIAIVVAQGLPPAVYSGILTVKNANCGSLGYPVSVKIQEPPSVIPVITTYQQ